MAMKLYSDTSVSNIATAIRGKQGLTGKNLFDIQEFVNEINAVSPGYAEITTYLGKSCVKYKNSVSDLQFMKGKFKQNTQYTFSTSVARSGWIAEGVVAQIFVIVYTDETSTNFASISTQNSYTNAFITSDANKTIDYITILGYAASQNVHLDISVTQIEEGTTATSYEPYCKYKIGEMDEEINKLPSVPAVSNLNVVGTTQESTFLTITDGKEAQINKIDVLGRTKQETTTGKNKFNKNTITSGAYLNSTGEIVTSSNSFYSDYIEVKNNFDYIMSGLTGGTARYTILYDENKNFIVSYQTNNERTFKTTNNTKYVRVSYNVDYLDTLQIEEGTTATSYEPYTGGPSPNPDYPSPIENVRGRNLCNSIFEQGSGLDPASSGGPTRIRFNKFLKINKGKTYTVKYFGVHTDILMVVNTSNIGVYPCSNIAYCGNPTQWVAAHNNKITFRCINDGYLSLILSYSNGGNITPTDNIDFEKFMIYEDDGIDIPYTPYNTISFSVEGKNKFNAQTNRTIKSMVNMGVQNFDGTGVYIGCSRNNYFAPHYMINYEITNDNKLKETLNNTYYGIGFDFIVKPNTQYIAKANMSASTLISCGFYDAGGNYIDNVVNATSTFTTPSNCKYILLVLTVTQANVEKEFDEIMLVEGSTEGTYESYHLQTVAFPLGEKVLMQGSKLTDYGFYDDKKQKKYDTGYYRNFENSYINLNSIVFDKMNDDIKNGITDRSKTVICDKLLYSKRSSGYYDRAENIDKILDGGNAIYFVGLPKTITTLEEAKTYLGDLIVEYPLKNPTITPYTTEQQTAYNQLKALLIHTGTNYITTDGNLPPNMKIEYKQDGLLVVRSED